MMSIFAQTRAIRFIGLGARERSLEYIYMYIYTYVGTRSRGSHDLHTIQGHVCGARIYIHIYLG